MSYIIHLEDVYVEYDGRTVLNNVDFKVSPGEFISIVGPTGCGKSTLLRLVLGSERPTSGKVLVDDEVAGGPSRNRGIVFQRYSLFPHLTVLQNIKFGPELENFTLPQRLLRTPAYSRGRKEYIEKAREYLNRIGLTDEDGDKYPYQLSGGMRQRVAIAQSLVMAPKILLMDEPFGALDNSTRQEMQLFTLERWEETKKTIFFVTHDLEEALFLGTRIIVLSPHYEDHTELGGSTIVKDAGLPGKHPKPTSFKYSQEFTELLEEIRSEGLDPTHLQRVSTFDLSHPDSFRTEQNGDWKDI